LAIAAVIIIVESNDNVSFAGAATAVVAWF
jgi:hypothetical protein